MPCCCVNTLNLCSVPVCGTLEIKQAATSSGAYTLLLDFLDTNVSLIAEQIEGENIAFDVSKLNENFQYTGQLFDSDGNLVSITVGETEYDCIKFKTIISLYAESATATPPVLNIPDTVVIEAVVGGDPIITGTSEEVTGIEDASNEITSNAFANVRIIFIRGNVPIPGIDPGDGSNYFTKSLSSPTISLNFDLEEGEFIRIQTIPS